MVLGLGGIAVAVLGLLDDRRPQGNLVRLGVWGTVATASVLALGGLAELRVGTETLLLGGAGTVLAIIGIVWMINLYNFMDGIDGLAATEGAMAAGAGAVLLFQSGLSNLAVLSAALAAACLGFLIWNWSPARIFMGDVGSGFIGFAFAAIAVISERSGGPSILVWGILLAVFIVDATLTVARRVLTGQPFWEGHKTHAYQLVVLSGRSHPKVVGIVVGLNLCLAGLAWIAATEPRWTAALAVLAYGTLGAMWLFVVAGRGRPGKGRGTPRNPDETRIIGGRPS
jgi:Fuc2NAc and GlcNAc transferase